VVDKKAKARVREKERGEGREEDKGRQRGSEKGQWFHLFSSLLRAEVKVV
jgi:hypothetical protein